MTSVIILPATTKDLEIKPNFLVYSLIRRNLTSCTYKRAVFFLFVLRNLTLLCKNVYLQFLFREEVTKNGEKKFELECKIIEKRKKPVQELSSMSYGVTSNVLLPS